MARGSKPKRTVLKDGRIVFRATVDVGENTVTGKRKQKHLSAPTKPELETLVAQTLADLSRGTYIDPGRMTVGEYLDHWLKIHGPNLGVRTAADYAMILRHHLKPALGNIPLWKLTPAQVQSYYTEALERGRKDNKKTTGGGLTGCTVLKHHRILREALSQAVKWEMLIRNPADAVKPPKKEHTEVETLTSTEVLLMLQAMEGTYLYMPTVLSLSTTMRLGECLGLPWTEVNLEQRYLSVTQTLKELPDGSLSFGPPKTKASRRRIDLSKELIEELKAQQAHQQKEKEDAGDAYQDHRLVCCLQDGSPIPPFNAGSLWSSKAVRALGKPAHFHMLRHTAATVMLEAGEPIKRVSEMLGHGSIAITGDIYGHVTPAGRQHAADTLGRKMLGRKKDVTKMSRSRAKNVSVQNKGSAEPKRRKSTPVRHTDQPPITPNTP